MHLSLSPSTLSSLSLSPSTLSLRLTQLHVTTSEAPRLCYLLCATPAQESHSGGKGISEAENGALVLVLAWAICVCMWGEVGFHSYFM